MPSARGKANGSPNTIEKEGEGEGGGQVKGVGHLATTARVQGGPVYSWKWQGYNGEIL